MLDCSLWSSHSIRVWIVAACEGSSEIASRNPHMSLFPFIAAGLTIIAVGVVVLLVAVVQDQRHLRSVQRELDQAKEQVIRSQATADDLEKSAAKLKRDGRV